jgi:hypothetical protein
MVQAAVLMNLVPAAVKEVQQSLLQRLSNVHIVQEVTLII